MPIAFNTTKKPQYPIVEIRGIKIEIILILNHKSKICKCNGLDKIIILVDKFIVRQ